MSTATVYLAGSISGLDVDLAYQLFHDRERRIRERCPHLRVLQPMTGKEHLLGGGTARPEGYHDPISSDQAIYRRDRACVLQADYLLVDLTRAATRASIGTTMELSWAAAAQDKIVIVGGLWRGERDGITHAMSHAFIWQSATSVWPTYEEAEDRFFSLEAA